MAGRPKYYNEDELIDRATIVFREKGYNAASAQDLMKAMGIGQGSLYRSFPGGKEELFKKSQNKFFSQAIARFHKNLDASKDPIVYIKNFFYVLIERTKQEKENGCYLGNAIVELSNLDEDAKMIYANNLAQLKDGFKKALIRAKKEGLLSEEKSPEALAFHLINFWNGVNITQRMDTNKEEIKTLIDLNLQVLS